ncbi:MAG TPA: hypothetical protein VL326_04770 [Kofleriaceae bacterium]|nr:hypothetical protein [Kofleriaceae bacterium]
MRAALSLVILLAACGAHIGGDDTYDNEVRPDAPRQQPRNPDAGMQQQPQPDASTTPVAIDNACGVASNLGDLGMLNGYAGAQLQQNSTTDRIRWVGSPTQATATTATPDDVYIELWDKYGAFNGVAAHTGTFTLSGDDLDWDTCGICVTVMANITNNNATKMLFATSGTVNITAVGTNAGQQTQATLTNATFSEITCDQTNGCVKVANSTCTSPISHVELRGTL